MKTIADIIKDTPQGTVFYSPMVGNLYFSKISNINSEIILEFTDNDGLFWEFDQNGKIHQDGECMIFRSKFDQNWDIYEEGDLVVCMGDNNEVIQYFIIKDVKENKYASMYYGVDVSDGFEEFDVRDLWYFDRIATDEEKEDFKRILSTRGLKWDNDNTVSKRVGKFKVGDKICCTYPFSNPFEIKKVTDKFYVTKDNISISINNEDVYELYTEPKFKIGDIIRNKQDKNNVKIITEIFGNVYIFENGSMDIKNQDDWEYSLEKITISEDSEGVIIKYNPNTHIKLYTDDTISIVKYVKTDITPATVINNK